MAKKTDQVTTLRKEVEKLQKAKVVAKAKAVATGKKVAGSTNKTNAAYVKLFDKWQEQKLAVKALNTQIKLKQNEVRQARAAVKAAQQAAKEAKVSAKAEKKALKDDAAQQKAAA